MYIKDDPKNVFRLQIFLEIDGGCIKKLLHSSKINVPRLNHDFGHVHFMSLTSANSSHSITTKIISY